MSEVEQKLDELEAIATQEVAEAADAPKAKAVKGEPSHIAKASGEVEDTGPAVTSPDAPKKDYAKKVAQVKDAQTAKADKGDSAPSSQGSSNIKEPLAAGDQVDHEGEDLAEMPQSKPGMLQAMYDKMKEMSKDDLQAMYNKMEMEDEAESEKEEEAEDAAKKEAVEKKIKEINVKEDVDALIDGEDSLSEEFKSKAATIFEAAIKSKVRAEIERLEEEYAQDLEESKESAKAELTEKVDSYLNYVVEEWMKENELAIEKGVKGEIAEDFISGLKQLFEDHYIDIPDEKYNVLESQATEIDELKGKLNEATSKIVELNKEVGEQTKSSIFESVSDSLADSEKEKFKGLVESIDYEDADSYKEKLETIKESYFVKEKVSNNVTETNDAEGGQIDMTESMSAYTAAISRTKAKKLY